MTAARQRSDTQRGAAPLVPFDPQAPRHYQPIPGAMMIPIESISHDPGQPRRKWRDAWTLSEVDFTDAVMNGIERDYEASQKRPEIERLSIEDALTNVVTYAKRTVGEEPLDELARSIKQYGVLQPITVRPHPDQERADRGEFMIIAGARRFTAAKRAGLTEIPCILRTSTGEHLLIEQLTENMHRQQLSPVDEARAMQALIDMMGWRTGEVALKINKTKQYVRDHLRLLRFEDLMDAVQRRQIDFSTAREIMKLPDETAMALREEIKQGKRYRRPDIERIRDDLAAQGIANPRRTARHDNAPMARPGDGPGGAETPNADALPYFPLSQVGKSPRRSAADTWSSMLARTDGLTTQPQQGIRRDLPWEGDRGEQPDQAYYGDPARIRRSRRPRMAAPKTMATEGGAPLDATIYPLPSFVAPIEQPLNEFADAVSPLNRAQAPEATGKSLDDLLDAFGDPCAIALTELLAYGVERGWTCAGLLQMVHRRWTHNPGRTAS